MRFKRLSVVTAVFTYLTILVGGFTRGSGAGLGCGESWPLCQGQIFPTWSNELMVIEWAHRYVALLAGIAIIGMTVAAWTRKRHDRRILWAATIAAILLPIQAILGAITVWEALAPWWSAAHMGTASALFGAVVAVTIFAYQPPGETQVAGTAGSTPGDEPGSTSEEPEAVSDYVEMTKPRICGLLAVMGLTGMVLAGGWPSLPVAVWTLTGGVLGAASGGVLNQVIERRIDRQMDRTDDRPLASGRVAPSSALTFAGVLAATSFTMLAFMVNVLAAVLTMLAVVFYVFVYTLWLKPSTPQGVVIGGAAGAAPALVGWAAVTGSIGVPAILLGLLVFVWTPPHFWALAIARKEEYEDAGFPMGPTAWGLTPTKRRMLVYVLATLAVAAAFPLLGYLGGFYLVASSLLGAAFLASTLHVMADEAEPNARRMFHVSLAYLGCVFVAMVADRLFFSAPIL